MNLKAEDIRLSLDESFRLLEWRRNLHEVELVLADGRRAPFTGSGNEWHYHAQTELTLIRSGAGTLFIGDSISPFESPDLVLIGPNLPHYWHMRRETSGIALQFDLASDTPFWQFPELAELRALWRESRRGVRITGPAAAEVSALIEEMPAARGLGRLARLLRILEVLASIRPKPLSQAEFAPPTRQATYRGLQKAILHVFQHFHEEIAFSDVLRGSGMSKATFERHFKRHTGKTFTAFVAEVRLHSASRQLIETDAPVGEIALASGYNNLSHFNHQFRARHGLSPRNFRRRHRAPAPVAARRGRPAHPRTPPLTSGGSAPACRRRKR